MIRRIPCPRNLQESVVISSSRSLAFLAALTVFSACAPKEPAELISARRAYEHASTSEAAQLAPAELHIAEQALATAETSFDKHPKYYETIDLAYIAQRRAQMAEATASANKAKLEAEASAKALAAEQTAQLAAAQEQLAAAQAQLASTSAALANLAAVKQEERGLVITLSGSVLFKSNESTLMPAAQTKLNQVVETLSANGKSPLVVEGHTDSQGEDASNQILSQKRADAVRDYMVSKGYDAALVTAQGIGEARPVADNNSPEGRANNRRVEIVVQNTQTASTSPAGTPTTPQ
jgi:outer membrane protein OmpA-like peptidoglycan-associated protein